MSTSELFLYPAIEEYLDTLPKSEHTIKGYRTGLHYLCVSLQDSDDFAIEETLENAQERPVTDLTPDVIESLLKQMRDKRTGISAATEHVYLIAIRGFLEYLHDERGVALDMVRIKSLIKKRKRKAPTRLPHFPEDEIRKVIEYALKSRDFASDETKEQMIYLRDRAFVLTLADTGLRVHEACQLKRGQINWNEGNALIIGKGDREALVRFSGRSMRLLKAYLNTRQQLDGTMGLPLSALPVFARHDRGAGQKVLAISTNTGRDIVSRMVARAVGESYTQQITPHSFRHFFVTKVLRATQGNMRMAQEMARHKNIATTQVYTHLANPELDKTYHDIFNT
jgi:site-specific recombinase XerD